MAYDSVVMFSIFSKDGISLDRLLSLKKVVESGSITGVAEGNANLQSQLSKQIGDLEKTLGMQLLDRARKPYSPTEAARRLADACGRFVREVEEIAAEESGLQSPITVGAGEVVIREFFIPQIGRQKRGKAAVKWVTRNLRRKKVQEGLEAEWLDVGIASNLKGNGIVEVVSLPGYGFKLLLPEGEEPDRSGWARLAEMPGAMLDGDAGFRQFLAGHCSKQSVELKVGAECTSFPQAVDLAEEVGLAVFVPEYWWKRRNKIWASRTQKLPGLEEFQREFHLGWNRKVVERRPEVAAMVKGLQGKR